MHLHFRNQEPGMGFLPTWDPSIALEISDAIRDACPGVLLNFSTGVFGDDISGPVSCLEACKPEIAAMNSGSLNYLKVRSNGDWAWPPLMFDNSVDKISSFLKVMYEAGIAPECECFDTGILRSVAMFREKWPLERSCSCVTRHGGGLRNAGQASWLPLLLEELPEGAHWQTIAIGRQEVWDLHRLTAELGGHLRTGVEDTFYLPNGEKTSGNGQLIENLVSIARECGREIASPEEARAAFAATELTSEPVN